MRRELAALEAGSLVLDSAGRRTRSSKQLACIVSNGVSESSVNKRLKRSVVQVEEVELPSSSSNRSNGVIKDLKDHGVRTRNSIHGTPDKAENADQEKVVSNVVIEVDEKGVGNNSLIVKDVAPGTRISMGDKEEDKASVTNLSTKGNVEVGNTQDVSLTRASDCDLANEININAAAIMVDKDRVLKETMSKSTSTPVNGDVKSYPRRFTRSMLKSTMTVASDSGVLNEEHTKEVVSKHNADGSREGSLSTQSAENNGDLKSVKKHTRRYKCSLESNVDGIDSSFINASDSVIPHKDNTEPVVIDEHVEADIAKNVEESLSAAPKRRLEMKMSKQIALVKIPKTIKELLETGLLEGCPVYYKGSKGPGLRGRVRGLGILCSCVLCQGRKVIPPSLFEIHACNSYKRAVQYIYLENGRSFIQILKACRGSHLNTLESTIQNAIGPLPERQLIVCQNCKETFYTVDTECIEPVCSSCIMSNLSPIGPVFSSRKPSLCRSSGSFSSFGASQAASACEMLDDKIQEKSSQKSPEPFLTPKLRSSPRIGKSSETKNSEKIEKESQEVILAQKTCGSPAMEKSQETKTSVKLPEKSFTAALPEKLSRSNRIAKYSLANDTEKTKKRLRKEVQKSKLSKNASINGSSDKRTSGKITRKDLRVHKVVFEDDVLPDGTELGYYAQGKKLLDGYKKGAGIFCSCCDTVVSASQFEAHAGCASRRKPYCYIYTSNGVSLHELSINLIKGRNHSVKFNDDLCSICADGGNLLLCDGCPRAFHRECALLTSIPRGKWYCKYCQNMFEREKFVAHNANAVAAGRVSGVDPIEQISQRSIRIVSNLASEVSACILCRGYDFCKSGFGPRTIILCDQCEKEYHVGCLKDYNIADLSELPEGKWFCSKDCGRIESALQSLLTRGTVKIPASLVNVIRKKHMQTGSECATDLDVSWTLLSGKIASPETRPLLSQAVAIFHESFAPIIDVVSGHDLIPAMVYGRNAGGQEYGGMYCAVLTINSVVVSAGIFRVFGPEVAELPLVATSSGNHGKGYFQALFACIERLLAFLKVKSFVLPAAEEAESIWTDRFGFTKMTPDQLGEFKRNYWSMVRFHRTSMLHKFVPEFRELQSQPEE